MRLAVLLVTLTTLALAAPPVSHHLTFLSSLTTAYPHHAGLAVTSRQSGLNFALCREDSACVGERRCLSVTGNTVVECSPAASLCGCIPTNSADLACSTQGSCETGEQCILFQGRQVCAADEVAPSLADEDNTGGGGSVGVSGGGGGDIDSSQVGDAIGEFTPASSGKGLNGDTCRDSSDCTAPRTCFESPRNKFCAPPTIENCSSDADCVDGEVCARIDVGPVCISEAVVEANLPDSEPPSSAADSVGDANSPGTDAQNGASTVTTTGPSGLTLDPCQEGDRCAGSRTCRKVEDNQACDGNGDCRCLPGSLPESCTDDSECEDGEGCFSAGDILDDVVNIPFLPEEALAFRVCISRAARDEAVCIASHSLAHISREELVFDKDAIAHVLCDLNESCATPGHMVQYKGKGMMMKSYCELTGCVRKVMKVNSPKYRRGLTVPSHTDDLVFTALAARFQSRAEEGVLSTAVRFGF